VLPGYEALDTAHADLIAGLSAAPVNSGDVVYIKSRRWKFVRCDTRGCHPNSGCPSSGDRSRCWGEQATIYNPAGHGRIMNGQVVWLKWARSHFLRCSNRCETGADCPYDANQRRNQGTDGCNGERFRIYNSQNSGEIQTGQTVWFKHGRHQWLSCTDSGGCDVHADCPNDASKREVTSDTGCYGERFILWK